MEAHHPPQSPISLDPPFKFQKPISPYLLPVPSTPNYPSPTLPTLETMFIVSLALRLLRIAGEAIFCFEVNRFLGRAVTGAIPHRFKTIKHAEQILLRHVNAPTKILDIKLPSGIIIHTIIATAPKSNSSNPAVLLHGHSMAAAFFFRNIDHLLDLGYSPIYIPDLPGWGTSTRPRFNGDVNSALNFFLTPLEHWFQVMQISNFTLVGHSLGAYLAHEYAIRNPNSVKRLILASPAAITRTTPLPLAIWFAFTPQRVLTHGGLLAHIMFNIRYPSEQSYNINGFRQLTLCTNSISASSGDAAAASMLRFWRCSLLRWRCECVRPLLECVARLSCPVEIIAGDCDDLVHIEAVRSLHRAMLRIGNDVRLNIIPGADHTPHISAPTKFAKAVMRGLSSVGSTHFRGLHHAIDSSMLQT